MMIEEIVKNHLVSCLGIPVVLERPENPPAEYVLIEKTGSGRQDHINTAVIAAQSYAGSMYLAAALNERTKAAMDRLAELPVIGKSALNSDYNFTDPDTKEYRYQAVYDLVYMEE